MKIIFLGSSVTYGSAAGGVSFADILCEKNGYEMIKEAVSGTTLVDDDDQSYVSRLKRIEADSADLFICQLSTNDASQNKPLGVVTESKDINSFDVKTIAGAVEYIIAYVTEKWNCPIAFYTGTKYDSKAYAGMVSLLKEITSKWNIRIINLWDEPTFNSVSEKDYKKYMSDPIHPTLEGYREWWTPFIEKKVKEMLIRRIDMSTYERKAHFDYFRSLQYPYVGVTVNQDVTDIYRFCKKNNCSFYLTFLHVAALAADKVPQFRQRISGDGIIEYPECPTSHIEQTKGDGYCYCTLHHHMSFSEYYEAAKAARNTCAENGITESEDVESMYFISTLPWLHYTSLIQPVAGGDESNPRITWGKFEETESGRIIMPVSVLAHHALVDGIHITQFFSNLEEMLQIGEHIR